LRSSGALDTIEAAWPSQATLALLEDWWKRVDVQTLTTAQRTLAALVPTVTEITTLPADRSVSLPEPAIVVVGTLPQEQAQPPAPGERGAHRPSLSIVPQADVVEAGPGTHLAYGVASWTKTCRVCGNLIPDRRIYCDQCRDEACAATLRNASYAHYHAPHPRSRANRDARTCVHNLSCTSKQAFFAALWRGRCTYCACWSADRRGAPAIRG
jgi:hypothetical protein